jgi:tryptophan 2,3-dioxygenase
MSEESEPASAGIRVDVSNEPIHWDIPKAQTYGEYLDLGRILSAQHPRSAVHDEMLFIVVHQTSELWLKLALHELASAMESIRRDELLRAFTTLTRIGHIQTQLTQVWDVLATLTPVDYSHFRNSLGRSSGFQSWQYRQLEFTIGNKNRAMIAVHRDHPEAYATLEATLAAPSLYDECLQLLSRRGFGIAEDVLVRDFSAAYVPHKSVAAAWLAVYHSTKTHWDLYELAERLIELDHRFQTWRFSHMKTVERIIGHKPGTGGTSGVSYLAKALELRFFPELWQVRTAL